MPLRLVGRVGERTLRLLLREGTNLVGSAAECDVRLEHPTVSRTHAELRVGGGHVELRDLDSRNGTFVGQRRARSENVAPGADIAFGHVQLRLETVDEADVEAAVSLPAPRAAEVGPGAGPATVRTKPVEVFALEKLPGLLRRAAAGSEPTALAQAAGAAAFESLPVEAIQINAGDAVVFEAHREASATAVERSGTSGELTLRVRFGEPAAAEAYAPVVDLLSTLLALAAHSDPPPPSAATPPQPPDPPSVVSEVQQLYLEAAKVARGDVGVLIGGESGTGKEVLARYIHAASPRAQRPFVALNCAALPRDLLETELFGIERGVATGVEARPGKFELAHGGTLFLDEIGDMAAETQAKLLRVLQEGAVYRIGGREPRPAAVRVVSATNRDMDRLLASGAFREDVYYRIATWSVRLPPLRQRRADIPNLAAHFLAREASRLGLRVRGISRTALDAMVGHPWPGNVRQLEKEIARAVLFLGDGDLLDSASLSPGLKDAAPRGGKTGGRLAEALEAVERAEILEALARCAQDVPRAAEELGLSRSTLYRRMKALGIEPPP
jgi:transcriptional regulator of acetoin/glycerol metabolism